MSLPRPSWRLLAKAVQLAVVAAATWFLAVPQAPAAWAAIGALAATPVVPIVAAALCAFVALVAYAQLLRVTLDHETAPGLWHTLGIITTSLGISNALPAGSAVGTVVTFRMLERAGVPRSRAAVAMGVTSLGSAVVLNLLLGIGLIALLPTRGLASGTIAALPVVVLLGGVVLMVRSILDGGHRLRVAARRLGTRFPNAIGGRADHALDSLTEQLTEWRAEPARVRRAVIWAVVNWLVDVLALWVALFAVGIVVNPIVALVAFALAHTAAMLPLTPGGLGIVELALAATLVGFGAPAAPVALGIAIYRLFNFWLPIPFSAVAWAGTRLASRGAARPDQPIARGCHQRPSTSRLSSVLGGLARTMRNSARSGSEIMRRPPSASTSVRANASPMPRSGP
jgi:hypothetical protein